MKKVPTTTTTEPKESPEEKGVRLALARMPRLKRQFKLVGNLGNYPLGEKRIEKLCLTIDEYSNACKVLLRNHNKGGQHEFQF